VSERLRRARERRAERAADPELARLHAASRDRGRPLRPLSPEAEQLDARLKAAGTEGLPAPDLSGPAGQELRDRGRLAEDHAGGRVVHQDVADESWDAGVEGQAEA
jgi:hypothetical protein